MRVSVPLLLILAVTASAPPPAFASDKDFNMIVKNIESRYNAKKKKIPFLGLAGFFVKIVKPAGVKSFKLAIFEDQDFAPGPRDTGFIQSVQKSLNPKWKPMVRSNVRSSGLRSYVYTQQSGKDIEMLSVTFDRRQAIVVQAKVNPDAMAKFLEKPEILGISLAGSLRGGPSPFDLANANINTGSGSGGSSGDSSLQSLRDDSVSQPTPDGKSKPVLRARSGDEDTAYNPLRGEGQPAASPAAARDISPEDVIKLEARLVNLNVKATDRGGNALVNLRKEDFTIYEDGVEQDIFYFEPVTAPINLLLLLDLSGSTQDKRGVMIEAAKKFVDSLGPNDRVAAAGFTRDFVVVSDFTTDRKGLKKKIDKMKKIRGGTAFYDAMWSALDLFRNVKDSRQAIVVLTDGVDNSLIEWGYEPADHSFEELLARVAEEDTSIYPIYLNPEESRLRNALQEPDISEMRRERIKRRLEPNLIARRQLEMLAEETAGTVFKAEDEQDLDGVYQKVAAELRLLYTLAYAPKNTQYDGKYRRLNVTVSRDGTMVKTRRGYYAK
ncbi:MAG TPA: VWA domain-containing protein [Blastocatellia bacterium]|nr:VWA domain-containing protein [Blastocatellia bacterium]